MKNPLIVLLSDFGESDIYSGVVKGVINSVCNEAHLVDLTHDILPQNIKQAAFILRNTIQYFAPDTIFVCVVDPGVGSERKSLILKTSKKYFIAPDNGLLSYIICDDECEIYELNNSNYFLSDVSFTFHGRDVYAPVAAHLANGTDIINFGKKINLKDIITIPPPLFQKEALHTWLGEVVYYDSFGNIITSLQSKEIGAIFNNSEEDSFKSEGWRFEIENHIIKGLKKTYSCAKSGELLAYNGSFGFIEIGIRNGNAAQTLNIKSGDKIRAIKFN
ncbi:MAG: SAM-dependent chlorinase/fluorinase [Ignavibacteriae bacterium]|nr:SAM-dependent chlorinase/fluorinase [Ignavibacteriota bacterium]